MCLQSFGIQKHPVQKPVELKPVFGLSQQATPKKITTPCKPEKSLLYAQNISKKYPKMEALYK